MSHSPVRFAVAGLFLGLSASLVSAQVNKVNGGPLITFSGAAANPNAAWCWFQEPRAILDKTNPAGPTVLFTAMSYAATGAERGDLDLYTYNLNTGTKTVVELANQLEPDDHDVAALYKRTDGRYVAVYSKHTSDVYTRWRVSTQPNNASLWQGESSYTNSANATYNNVFYLPSENRLYNFSRINGWDPTTLVSTNQGSTFTFGGKLISEGGTSDRPYARYASNGDKIFMIITEEHPRDNNNSIYGGFVKNGALYNSLGVVKDSNILDGNPNLDTSVAVNSLTQIFAANTVVGGETMTHSWTIDLKVDSSGNPAGIFSTRVSGSTADHRFFYARFDGAQWVVNQIAKAGFSIYPGTNPSEPDYTGLAVIDPADANTIYMSSDINPLTGLNTTYYEMYRGHTDNFGQSWTWSAITENSTMDNIRPILPTGTSPGDPSVLLWMRGTYTSYTNWSTQAVGMVVPEPASCAFLLLSAPALLLRRRA